MAETENGDLLADLKARFQDIAGEDGVVDPDEFRRALRLTDDYYAERLFKMVDEDASGSIELAEFLAFVETLMTGDEESRIRFAFRLHDPDDSGSIDPDELARIIRASVGQHGLELPDRAVEGLAEALFRHADDDASGEIDFDEFRQVLEDYPALKKQMTFSAAAWLKPSRPPRPAPGAGKKLGDRFRRGGRWMANNRSASTCLILYALANVLLFQHAVDTYAAQGANVYVQIARGGGACLNFNGMLILIPMLRYLLTWVRQSTIGGLLPVDDSIAFHKLVGHVMMGFAVLHTVAHLANYTTLPEAVTFYLFQTPAGLTGFLLMAVFGVMWVCALDFIRRGGHFELFYFTHFGYVAWFVLCLMHGPVFWQWAALPIAGYLIERVARLGRTNRAMPVNALEPLASGVTRLELQLPEDFRYQSGDYVFIKYPAVSKHEWHPFTVTTAPEETGRLSVHVRGLGNWTKKLHQVAKAAPEDTGHGYIDGPYGTPSARIFDSPVAVLIGAGIGVTPYAAILKSLFHRRTAGGDGMAVEKVHFIWMNRDQFSFEWFSEMLAGLEAEDTDASFLDTQVYMTGVKVDMTSAMLDIAMDVHQAETGRDLFTGLRNRTNLDRPKWPDIFEALAAEHAGRQVDVYFCGPPALSTQLAELAARHRFGYHKENF